MGYCLKEENSVSRLVVISTLWFMAGCSSPTYVDLTGDVTRETLAVPAAHYNSAAWLDADIIALAYKNPHAREGETRIALYQLGTQELDDIILPDHPDHCYPAPSNLAFLDRLPDGRLGYLYICFERTGGQSAVLFAWDKGHGQSQVLHEFKKFPAGSYALSPDLSELLQESTVGVGLSNELYRFELGGEGREIFGHFQRAASPSWSPDGKTIAFAGTESTPYDSPQTNRDMANLLFSPWSIYIMEADGSGLREILTGISYPGLRWSPDGKCLAFSGTYQDVQKARGIWLLDIETRTVQLISKKAGPFSWSPDGGQILFLEPEESEDPLHNLAFPTILTFKPKP